MGLSFFILLKSENGFNVVNPLSSPRLRRHVESTSNEIFLLVLDLHHLTLDRLIRKEFVDEDLLVLPESVNSVKALPLAGPNKA